MVPNAPTSALQTFYCPATASRPVILSPFSPPVLTSVPFALRYGIFHFFVPPVLEHRPTFPEPWSAPCSNPACFGRVVFISTLICLGGVEKHLVVVAVHQVLASLALQKKSASALISCPGCSSLSPSWSSSSSMLIRMLSVASMISSTTRCPETSPVIRRTW